MDNNVIIKEITMDEALKMIADLSFERFKAHIQGDEVKANTFSEEIEKLEKAIDEGIKK